MNNPLGVVIQGGSGFGAGELLRYLAHHPGCEVAGVVSSSQAGQPVAKAHPHLLGFYDHLTFDSAIPWQRLARFQRRVIFLALPHGHAMKALAEMGDTNLAGTTIIDLSADFRLAEEPVHLRTYPDVPFAHDVRKHFVYGLSEINRDSIASASRIANPGCLASAGVLAAYPLVKSMHSRIIGSLCFDAKTGTSGAGRTPQESMHHPQRHGNFEAYKVLAHRHEPEIRQALGLPAREGIGSMFVPHLLPASRGIFVTLYAQLQSEVSAARIEDAYAAAYRGCAFIRFRDSTPRLHDVVGTNFCDISICVRGTQIVVMAALDNLGKGMAGQAIQNMNLRHGFDEQCGLRQPALGIS